MPPFEPVPGARVGRFRLVRCLGSGGMGSVWAAEGDSGGETAALKILHPSLALAPVARLRLLREAKASQLVLHPAIVPAREILTMDETLVLVMDLLAGETLRERLVRKVRLASAEAAALLEPVAAALEAAHAAGVVHRDLKPENIFVTRAAGGTEVVRVLDFGVAKLLEVDPAESTNLVTGLGALLGTIAYMAPEQVRRAAAVDSRADIWSLGVVLYEALAGCRPIEGTTKNDTLRRLLLDAVPPILALAPDLPPELAEVLGRMLSRAPERRPGAGEVRAVLGRFAQQAGGVYSLKPL
jgi:serine/threonine-protein kinase